MRLLYCLFFFCGSYFLLGQTVVLSPFATGFSQPVEIVNCGDSRLFVAQQNGLIRILQSDGTILADPFLSISSLVTNSGERGLLGMAFHPNYTSNGYFFLNYIDSDGNTVIARYQVSTSDPNIAVTQGEIVMTIAQPYNNHNGGCIRFGLDGMLYIGMGDGGSGGDPNNYAQNSGSLLGKMLRVNVDQLPYSIPDDNPFLDEAGIEPEIYYIGLRNPWKFSFDYSTNDIWIADVGQNAWEEVNRWDATIGGSNFGWRCYEGDVEYNMNGCQPNASFISPVHVYANSVTACSITGGYVYRGVASPSINGTYFFSDYCSNAIYALNTETYDVQINTGFSGGFATFGEDYQGELYVAGRNNGRIFKLTYPYAATSVVEDLDFELFPNPSNGIVEFKTNHKLDKANVFDLEGRLVLQLDSPLRLDLTSLDKGYYLISCELEGRQKTIKIILQ